MNDIVKKAREFFRENHSYIALDQMSDLDLNAFLNLSHVRFYGDGSPTTFSYKMNLLYDYVVSQDLVDVTP
jgi:hypothetical protein